MRSSLLWLSVVAALTVAPAHAATVSDPVGDFVTGFVGPTNGDLDVTSFSVDYSPATSTFTLSATMAGAINPTTAGFYITGVNTGTGVIAPFASLGNPNVIFNQTVRVNKDGSGSVGATTLVPSTITIAGNTFSVQVPLALLPSTGFSPGNNGFNLWPRVGTANNQISDFAPDNANLAAVQEPATWALFLIGFSAAGYRLRRRQASLAAT